jgi:hypothetical protein
MEREQRSKYREQFAFGVKTFGFELTLPDPTPELDANNCGCDSPKIFEAEHRTELQLD